MKRLILFLIRRKLGLKLNERFQFVNQKSGDIYFFTREGIRKQYDWSLFCGDTESEWSSSVSLNWLLNDECEIVKCKDILRRKI